MLKRTERLIDAVKLIRLLETMEGKDAELTIRRTGILWEVKYSSGDLNIEIGSDTLDEAVDEILLQTGGENGRDGGMPVLSGKDMAGEE